MYCVINSLLSAKKKLPSLPQPLRTDIKVLRLLKKNVSYEFWNGEDLYPVITDKLAQLWDDKLLQNAFCIAHCPEQSCVLVEVVQIWLMGLKVDYAVKAMTYFDHLFPWTFPNPNDSVLSCVLGTTNTMLETLPLYLQTLKEHIYVWEPFHFGTHFTDSIMGTLLLHLCLSMDYDWDETDEEHTCVDDIIELMQKFASHPLVHIRPCVHVPDYIQRTLLSYEKKLGKLRDILGVQFD